MVIVVREPSLAETRAADKLMRPVMSAIGRNAMPG